MRVLITGGAGNLGRRLAQLFVEDGHQARVFDLPQVDYSFFDGMRGIEIAKGDIRDRETVGKAVKGVDIILHLAALIPPASERNRAFTIAINVGGTENLLEAGREAGAHFVLASSVATYGDTTGEEPPVRVSHPQATLDIYSESKILSEGAVKESGLPYTILRIAPISIPEPMDPPDAWPYKATQRVEFVNRDDVADALFACAGSREARGKTLNIAGGTSWQLLGRDYVSSICDAMGIEDEQLFADEPGWFDWYDTTESQALLSYQNTPFHLFVARLREASAAAFGW